MASIKAMAAAALVFTLTAAVLISTRPAAAPPAPRGSERPIAVVAAPVRLETLADRIEAVGTALANESAALSPTVTERVVAVHFEEGQFVRRGSPIVTLDQREDLAARDAAAEQLAEHERELARLESLLQNQSVARQPVDQRRTLLRVTQKRIQEIEARIQARTIRAPFDGVLGLRRISVGALVKPGDVVTTIDDVSRIKLDFAVPEVHLGLLRPGAVVRAESPARRGRIFEGVVATVDSRVDPTTRSGVVRAVLPNPDRALVPGMLLTVTLLKNERPARVIPEEALVPLGQRHRVWVIDPAAGNAVARREVTIGGRRPGAVEILHGLDVDELVVVAGADLLKPGSRVEIAAVLGTTPAATGAGGRGDRRGVP